jgi:hypothetical protein
MLSVKLDVKTFAAAFHAFCAATAFAPKSALKFAERRVNYKSSESGYADQQGAKRRP